MSEQLKVDWIACDGRGLCAELLPELIEADEWGYPLIAAGAVPADLLPYAQKAIKACPTMALRFSPV